MVSASGVDRGQYGEAIWKEKRHGQDFPYARVHSCTDPGLKETLERAPVKVLHLCRQGDDCGSTEPCALHVRRYTGIDAKAELDLEEDRGPNSPLWALTLLVFRTCREWMAAGVRRVLDVGCGCCRRRSRRQKKPPVQVCKDQLDEEDWAPCDAEAVG